MVANLKAMDLYEKRRANPVHFVNLETGEIICGLRDSANPKEKFVAKMRDVSCLRCRRILMASSRFFRSVWGQ